MFCNVDYKFLYWLYFIGILSCFLWFTKFDVYSLQNLCVGGTIKMEIQINGSRKKSDVKSTLDYEGHRLVMIEAKSDGRIVWHWSDGAITPEKFVRTPFFNFCYRLISMYRHNRIKIKLLFWTLFTVGLYFVLRWIVSVWK